MKYLHRYMTTEISYLNLYQSSWPFTSFMSRWSLRRLTHPQNLNWIEIWDIWKSRHYGQVKTLWNIVAMKGYIWFAAMFRLVVYVQVSSTWMPETKVSEENRASLHFLCWLVFFHSASLCHLFPRYTTHMHLASSDQVLPLLHVLILACPLNRSQQGQSDRSIVTYSALCVLIPFNHSYLRKKIYLSFST